ncbi:hypothetical protein TNCV_4525441 [Trichonephila clavipes]|nr:hypothetical protein TNCV_4525441 [Trichonephila clavipes]
MVGRNIPNDFKRGLKPGGGPNLTRIAEELGIIKSAVKRAQCQSASASQQLYTATGRQVSRFTVDRRLYKKNQFACRPGRCIPLKVDHRWHP